MVSIEGFKVFLVLYVPLAAFFVLFVAAMQRIKSPAEIAGARERVAVTPFDPTFSDANVVKFAGYPTVTPGLPTSHELALCDSCGSPAAGLVRRVGGDGGGD